MRTLGKWILTVSLLALCGVGVRAAEPAKIVAHEGAMRLILLRQASVQEELKLTKEQVDKIEAFGDEQWKKAQDIHKLEPEKAKPEWDKLHTANVKFLADTLKPEQAKRLEQVGMHVAGLLWVLDPTVASALSLTSDQKKKIEELHKTAHKETEDAVHIADKAARTAKLEELRKAHHTALIGVLTSDQKTKWKELAGDPFKGRIIFVHPSDDKK